MKNYIHKIARDNLRKNKKFYKYIFLSIFFVFFFITFTTIISFSMDKVSYEQNSYYYGKWDSVVMDCDEIKENRILECLSDMKTSYMFYSGEVLLNNKSIGNIGYFDEKGLKTANLHLIKGRLADKEEEIVLEESMIDILKAKLNQNIKLTYKYNNQIYEKHFIIVGIVEDYTNYWESRGLSFIAYSMSSNEYDMFVKTDDYVVNLWNDIEDIFMNTDIEINIVNNEKNYPQIVYQDFHGFGNNVYTNETLLLPYTLEIILISFISIIMTVMSSLDKRERQFVLFRSIGMTYKQLQKLIVYEGYLLSLTAFLSSTILAALISTLFMVVYCFYIDISFVWNINMTAWLIQIIIVSLILAFGIILPTLTVYDLPLTRKDGQYIYHPKKKKYRKPTFLNLIIKEFKRYLASHIFISVIVLFVLFRGNQFVYEMIDYNQTLKYYTNYDYKYDFILELGNLYDISELDNIKDIKINKIDKIFTGVYWDDMLDDEFNRDYRIGGIMSIDQNNEDLTDYLLSFHIDIRKLKDNQCIILIPNDTSLQEIIDYQWYEDNYALQVGKEISLYDDKTIKYEIIDIIPENNKIPSLYKTWENYDSSQDMYILINENEFKSYFREWEQTITVKADNKSSKKITSQYLHDYVVKNIQGNSRYTTFIDSETLRDKEIYQIKNEFYDHSIYSLIMFILSFFITGLIRLMSSYKLRKDIGLLNILGMTKRKIYLLYYIHSTIIYLLALFIMIIAGFFVGIEINVRYIMVSFLIYVIYVIVMILPIRSILNNRMLDLIQKVD